MTSILKIIIFTPAAMLRAFLNRTASSTVTAARTKGSVVQAGGAVGRWEWRSFAAGGKGRKGKGAKGEAEEGGVSMVSAGISNAGKGPIDEAKLAEILASPNPAEHRPGDAGKVFRLDKEELKNLFPRGISGAWHLLLFGSRTKLPQPYRRNDEWYNVILKQHPAMIIRKEASHIMSALSCVSRQGLKTNGVNKMNTPGFLIDGAPGTGKSAILNHVAHWAMKTGEWIVIWVPHASDLVSGLGFYTRTGGRGEFIGQPQYAIEYISNILEMNMDKIKGLEIDEDDKFPGKKVCVVEAIQRMLELPQPIKEEQAMGMFEKVPAPRPP